ncbi:hypothetical protein, partial [Pseudomonas sp. FG-3G]
CSIIGHCGLTAPPAFPTLWPEIAAGWLAITFKKTTTISGH